MRLTGAKQTHEPIKIVIILIVTKIDGALFDAGWRCLCSGRDHSQRQRRCDRSHSAQVEDVIALTVITHCNRRHDSFHSAVRRFFLDRL